MELLKIALLAITQVPVCCANSQPGLTASSEKAAWHSVQLYVCLLSAICQRCCAAKA